MIYRHRVAALVLGAACLTVSSCSLFPHNDDSIRFNGTIYTAVNGANVEVTSQGLVVENAGTGEYGVRARRPRGVNEADFRALPVDLPENGRWGLEVFRGVDNELVSLATVWNEATDAETHQVLFDFDPVLDATLMTLEYYLDGQLLYSVPDVPINPVVVEGERTSSLAPGGESDGEPESVHIVRDGPRIIVSTDYGGDPPDGGNRGGCSGTLMRVDFPNQNIPQEFCTDYVQAIPQTELDVPDLVGVEVRAEVLDQFTLTSATLVR